MVSTIVKSSEIAEQLSVIFASNFIEEATDSAETVNLSPQERAKKIIICPSNPIVSIGTILHVKAIRNALKKFKNKIFGISPIIGGATVKGPADKLMKFMGLEVSSFGVAEYYKELLGHFIIDNIDCKLKSKIEDIGIRTYCYDTLMTDLNKKKELARFLINI